MITILAHQTTLPTATSLASAMTLKGYPCQVVTGEGLRQNSNRLQSILRSNRSEECENNSSEEQCAIVNWGLRISGRLLSSLGQTVCLNKEAPINKPEALQRMKDGGVKTVPFLQGKWISRPKMTRKGRGMKVIDGLITQHIDKQLEFRCDVMNGGVFRIHVKKGPADMLAWNRCEAGEWKTYGVKDMRKRVSDEHGVSKEVVTNVIAQSKAAVASLKYDFGAVDVIIDGDGNPYVLEVNSAPSLNEAGLSKYANRIIRIINESRADQQSG